MMPHKKDGTRLLKVVCPNPDCGYLMRTTERWIKVGLPICPCGTRMEMAELLPEPGEGERYGDGRPLRGSRIERWNGEDWI